MKRSGPAYAGPVENDGSATPLSVRARRMLMIEFATRFLLSAFVSAVVLTTVFDARLIFCFLIAIAFHEFGHFLALRRCKIEVTSVTVYPTGGWIAFDEEVELSEHEDLLVSLSGPIAGFLGTFVTAIVAACGGYSFIAIYSIAWGLFNLADMLPIPFADGMVFYRVYANRRSARS